MALRRSLVAAFLAAVALAVAPSSAAAAECDKVASPGPDAAQDLVDSLQPGQVGCLHAGRYHEDVTVNHGGTGEDARIVLRSFPGERARLDGRLYVPDRSRYVTVEQLDLNGHDAPPCSDKPDCRLPSPTVNGDHALFQDNDVTNEHLGICFAVGGGASQVVIRRNRIHNCGVLPANNHEHGIYLTETEGVQILDNVIYDNADRGIQLYPNADRTVIRGNIVDGNGQGIIFSGVGSGTSDDNVVENNLFTNAKIRFNIESWYPDGTGSGNVARDNCVFNGARGNIGSQDGFTAVRNLVADPLYVDRGGKDFRLKPGSPCAAVLAGAEAPATPTAPTVPELPVGGGDEDSGETTGTGDEDSGDATEPTGKPGEVILENVSLKRNKRTGRWRLRVAGHLTGWGAEKLKVQVRRGDGWVTLGSIRDIRKIFRASVRPPVARLRKSNRMTVRVVIPGVDASNAVVAKIRR
jgi:parallel beta-helix repeat protein